MKVSTCVLVGASEYVVYVGLDGEEWVLVVIEKIVMVNGLQVGLARCRIV